MYTLKAITNLFNLSPGNAFVVIHDKLFMRINFEKH